MGAFYLEFATCAVRGAGGNNFLSAWLGAIGFC